MIHEELINIGLTDKEARVYIACLELGEGSVQDIALRSKVNRITTHVAIEKLVEMNLVREQQKGKRRRIVAEMPKRLVDRLVDQQVDAERKVTQIEKLLPQLESIYNYSDNKPKVFFYEGMDGVKEIYKDSIATKGQEFLAFTGFGETAPELTDWLIDTYIPKRVEQEVFAKVIAPSTELAVKMQGLDDKHKREIALIPNSSSTFAIELMIYGNRISIVSLPKDKLMGVIIESQEVATAFKLIFELAWEAAQSFSKK